MAKDEEPGNGVGCVFGAVTRTKIQELGDRFTAHTDSVSRKFDAVFAKLDQLANRLPTWAVVVISVLTAALGGLAGILIAG